MIPISRVTLPLALALTACRSVERVLRQEHDVAALVVGLSELADVPEERAESAGGLPEPPSWPPRHVVAEEDLAALVRARVLPGSWAGEHVSVVAGEGSLVVTHTAQAQREMARFLEGLRGACRLVADARAAALDVRPGLTAWLEAEWRELSDPCEPARARRRFGDGRAEPSVGPDPRVLRMYEAGDLVRYSEAGDLDPHSADHRLVVGYTRLTMPERPGVEASALAELAWREVCEGEPQPSLAVMELGVLVLYADAEGHAVTEALLAELRALLSLRRIYRDDA